MGTIGCPLRASRGALPSPLVVVGLVVAQGPGVAIVRRPRWKDRNGDVASRLGSAPPTCYLNRSGCECNSQSRPGAAWRQAIEPAPPSSLPKVPRSGPVGEALPFASARGAIEPVVSRQLRARLHVVSEFRRRRGGSVETRSRATGRGRARARQGLPSPVLCRGTDGRGWKLVEGAGFEPANRSAGQIYSLLPLTTRPPLHLVSPGGDSNP